MREPRARGVYLGEWEVMCGVCVVSRMKTVVGGPDELFNTRAVAVSCCGI